VLTDNPIAYWRLGETSGIASDTSGNGRHGTYLNGPTLGGVGALAGDPNTSARFDGVNDSVRVPDDAALRLNDSWSIEFWAKQSSFVHAQPGIIAKGDATKKDGYAVLAAPNGELFFMLDKKKTGSGPGALTSAFRYFVVTYDGHALRWYVNGALSTTKNQKLKDNKGKAVLELGRGVDYGDNVLDEVAMYATALSGTRIAAHYGAGS
jgi:hypothetical protein